MKIVIGRLCEYFVLLLDSGNRTSLGIQLEKLFKLDSTRAAELTGMMIDRSDKSIRTWKSKFLEKGEILDIKQSNI